MAVDRYNMVETMVKSQFSEVLELLEDVSVHCAARRVTKLSARIYSSQHVMGRSRGSGVLACNSDDSCPSVLTHCAGGR